MKGKIERRHFVAEGLEIREIDGQKRIAGHAAVFDSLSLDLGGWRERIASGAFTDTLRDDDQVALWSHDSALVLASTAGETLELNEDNTGLAFVFSPADTSAGRDTIVLIERGDVRKMSFGFRAIRESWAYNREAEGADRYVRTVEKLRLYEISPVAFPAYPDTDVGTRSFEQFRERAGDEFEKKRGVWRRKRRERDLRMAEASL